MKIIDTHAHIFPEKIAESATQNICDFYGFPREMAMSGTLDDCKNQAKKANVDYLVVNSTATKPEQVEAINSWIGTIVDEKVFGLGTLHQDYNNVESEVERIISLGLKGVKLHPDFQQFCIDDEKLFNIYEALQGKLPLLIHCGDKRFGFSSPKRLSRVLELFPKLDVIAAHLGGWSEWEASKEFLWGKRVWFDTCSSLWFMPPEEATKIIRGHDIEKIFFGTDYPIFNQTDELMRIDKLGLTLSEKEKILFNNSNNFYKLNL